jgi:hypothetical protein
MRATPLGRSLGPLLVGTESVVATVRVTLCEVDVLCGLHGDPADLPGPRGVSRVPVMCTGPESTEVRAPTPLAGRGLAS